MKKAQEYLESCQNMEITIEMSMVDGKAYGLDVSRIVPGMTVSVESEPHHLNNFQNRRRRRNIWHLRFCVIMNAREIFQLKINGVLRHGNGLIRFLRKPKNMFGRVRQRRR